MLAPETPLSVGPPAMAENAHQIALCSLCTLARQAGRLKFAAELELLQRWVSVIELHEERRVSHPTVQAFAAMFSNEEHLVLPAYPGYSFTISAHS